MNTLNYDAGGFIVGVNKMKDGIDNVHDDTQEIIQILKSQNQIGNTRMRELTRAVKSANYRSESQASANTSRARSSSFDRRPRISSSASTDSINNRNRDRASNRTANRSTISRNSVGATDRGINSSGSNDHSTRSSDGSSSDASRERDANGRFTSGDGANVSRSSNSGFGGGFNGGLGHSDVSGLDPVLDSLKEAKDLLSPIGRAGKLAGRAAKFSWSKFKSMKRREPLSNDETRHNREKEKLLDKIWKAIRQQGGRGGNAGRGLLGGLLSGAAAGGGLLKKLGKMKFLGPLAALAGAGSLAVDWDNLDHQGKSEGVGGLAGAAAGGLAGMKLGAMAGAIGGPIGIAIGGTVGGIAGAWLGNEGGEALGAAASPYIEDWTESLKRYKLAEKMDAFWKGGMTPVFSSFHSLGEETRSWFAKQFDGLFDNGGADPNVNAGDVSAGVTVKANKAADIITKNALTRSSGYCAKFVREGLQQAGYDLKTMGDAKNYNNGALQDAGFSVIDSQSVPQKGDVMVMPAQGKHSAGHIQIYDGQDWVSDFKQKSKNPWGDISNENLQYTMYRDERGAMVPGTARGGENVTGAANSKAGDFIKFFTARGYTKEQAIGLAANIQQESQFDHTAYNKKGGGNGAKGLAQWRGPRQDAFKKKYGKDLLQASRYEQMDFIDHELKTTHKSAGNALKRAKTTQEATRIVLEQYEKPGNISDEMKKRAANANAITNAVTRTNPKANSNGILGFSAKDINKAVTPKISSSSNGTPLKSNLGYEPANLPASPILKIPAAPKIKERLDSGGSNKPVMFQSSNDTINQNLSDRGLAHAVTGGFGQDRNWG